MPEAKADKKTKQEAKDKADITEFLALAQERFKLAEEAESEVRREALDDLKFLTGEQWPQDIKSQRNSDGRPCLTMNRLPQFKRQITNEQRQQRPSINVDPIGDGADKETADILQGVCRHIEVNSDAEIAYDTAFESMVSIGFGYYRVLTEYIEGSFDQEIIIKRVKNPFTVYMDCFAIEPDYSDADWAFVAERMSKFAYKAKYPKSEMASLTDFQSVGDMPPGWVTTDGIRICEYFRVEYEKQTIQAGSQSREETRRKVIWTKINAVEKLEEDTVWAGKWIPIIPVLGDDVDVDGKRYLAGMTRNAKDPQRMYNYWVSAGTEMIALAPRAPFVGVEGQFEGHEQAWKQANTRSQAYLEYKDVSAGGKPAAPPQRQVYEPPVQAIHLMTLQADADLKATTGINAATLGDADSERSGKAILARQKQSDVATLNYSDNMARSIRHTGRVLLDLIPKIYDAPRVQRIVKPDQTVDQVGVFNSQTQQMSPAEVRKMMGDNAAIKKVYDIGVGRYDVTVSVGPSYQSKRQEAVQTQLALIGAYPPAMPIIGDLLVRNMDIPGADQIADRLKKMLPPNLQEDADQDPEAQLQKAQSQLQALSQQHDALVQQLNQLTDEKHAKVVENDAKVNIAKLDAMSKESIVRMQEATKLAVAQINASKDLHQTFAENEIAQYGLLHKSAADRGLSAQEHAQSLQQQDQQHSQALEQQDQAGQQALVQQDQAGQQAMAAAKMKQPTNGAAKQ